MPPITTTTSQRHVGDLFCQRNPYAKELKTTCIDCSEKKDKKGFYQIKLQDTVLFPEGGGQPYDTGSIDGVQVFNVQRQGLEHVHYTKEPIPVGKEVLVKVDWDRRWDHMQQHSGQHLLSAVIEQEPYCLETGSWNLGASRCYIELETKNNPTRMLTTEQMQQVERRVNQIIIEGLPVIVHTRANDHHTDRPDSVPDDYVGGGTIRTIEIQGLDRNPCCGTHVSSTSHLQMVKLLHTENVRGGNVRLFFLFGQRVACALEASLQINRQLNGLLSVPPELFVDNVSKLQTNNRSNLKAAKRYATELAHYVAQDLMSRLEKADTAFLYRPDGELDFLVQIANTISLDNREKAVVLAAGEKGTGGPVVVVGGTQDAVQRAVKTMSTVLAENNIKGGGKGRWQGKSKSWKGIDELQKEFEKELQV
ncbi:hypothetical protein BX666DRAFT_647881 [Dichotomocladium elegans]|nr:hypothetical protein BX666DRAFT_647881 [Dichotomocladium elegans]